MYSEKRFYLEKGMFSELKQVNAEPKGSWGKMNFIQMIEHIADFFDVSSGKKIYNLVTPEEYLPKYREFLFSEKQFRENTKAPGDIIPDEPLPPKSSEADEAIAILKNSVNDFFTHFKMFPENKTVHPAFGPLTMDEWILLHYKHVTHHFRQFGILPPLT